MIVHKHHMLQAGQSKFSSMRAFVRQHALGSKVPNSPPELAALVDFQPAPIMTAPNPSIRHVDRGKDTAAIAQDPAEEEPWLYESGGMGDFELCAFDRASVAVTRSRPVPDPSGSFFLVLSSFM